MKTWKLTFEVETLSGMYPMYRHFKTESEDQAKAEAKNMERELSSKFSEFRLIKMEQVRA